MKLPPARLEAFVAKPDPQARAVLVYGPDTGLVRERIERLTKAIVPDPKDPFRITELTAAQLRDDPARLRDEAAAIPFGGGRKVVRVRDIDDAVALIQPFLDDPVGDALVLVEAGDLGKTAKLRKLFEEGSTALVALPCYADSGRSLDQVIAETLRQAGLSADGDAMAWLADHLGNDRKITRAELDKLVLYMGSEKRVTMEHAQACIGDAAGLDFDDLVYAVGDGDQIAVQRVLDRLLRETAEPVRILRAVSRHFMRLHYANGLMAQGKTAEQAAEAMRPPLFFKVKGRFTGQLKRWSGERLASAIDRLLAAEMDCKTTGLPAPEICGRALIQITRAARRR